VNDVLKEDLRRSTVNKAKHQAELEEFEALEKNLKELQESGAQTLKIKVDLGAEVYCTAHVPDTSRLYLDIGLGFHLEVTPAEAPRIIALRKAALQRKIEQATLSNAKIKCHIRLAEEGIRELMALQP